MSWDGTSNPKYHTPEHRRERARLARLLKRNGSLDCAQPRCIEPSGRAILPGMRWAVGHDDTGQHYIGPVHKRCNDVDAATRGSAVAHGKLSLPNVDEWFA